MMLPQSQAQKQLPPGFQPSITDVVCGKGKACYNHSGNQTFRMLVEANLPRYISAATRLEKGRLVTEISQVIRSNAKNGGGFVKLDYDTGLWFEVGNVAAKEKVAQTMRELVMKTNPEKEARKLKKRAISRALRLAAKKDALGCVSVSASSTQAASSGPTETAENVTTPESILATMPPPLVYQSSRDWFDDSDLSETSVTGPGEELDETFFDYYALSHSPSILVPALISQSSGGDILTKEFATTLPPSLMHQSSIEFFTAPNPPMLNFQTSTDSFCAPTPPPLKLQTSIGNFSTAGPPPLAYQSSSDWFSPSDATIVDSAYGIGGDFFDAFASNPKPDLPRCISIC
jgi:hypothetical protein